MRTLVRFVSGVDLPVPVETAGVGQQLAALLALDTGLAVGSDLSSLNASQRVPVSLQSEPAVPLLAGAQPVVVVGQQLRAKSVRNVQVGQ